MADNAPPAVSEPEHRTATARPDAPAPRVQNRSLARSTPKHPEALYGRRSMGAVPVERRDLRELSAPAAGPLP